MKTLVASFAVVLALAFGGALEAFAQAPNADRQPCSEMGGDPSKTLSEKLDQGSGHLSAGCRSGDQSAYAGRRQNAGDPATGQSRRRSESAAEMRKPLPAMRGEVE
jgi:hypothetical protein